MRIARWAGLLMLGLGLFGGCGSREPLSQREVAMKILGEYVQKTLKPRSVLLMGNPYTLKAESSSQSYRFQKASESGLRKGLAQSTPMAVAFPALKPEAIRDPRSVYVNPNSTTPLSFLLADEAFEQALNANPQTDLVVSVIGLPVNAPSMAWWTNSSPRFALLLPDLRMIGDAAAIRQAFVSGKITAAIVPKPGATPGADEAFDKAFVLVTSQNVDGLLPLLFQ